MNWIRTRDQLPEVGRPVLVYSIGTENRWRIDIAYRMQDAKKPADINGHVVKFMWYGGIKQYFDYEITHWMPLPEKPGEQEEQEETYIGWVG